MADDEGWATVKDKKKAKKDTKMKELEGMKALAAARRKLSKAGVLEYSIPADFDQKVLANPERADKLVQKVLDREAGGHGQASTGPKKKKSSSSSSNANKAPKRACSTADDLVALVMDILRKEPGGWLHVSAIGNRLEGLTGASWNTRFKPSHGKLGPFIEANKRDFHLVQEEATGQPRVYIRAAWEQQRAAINKKKKARQVAEERERESAGGVAPAAARRGAKRGLCCRLVNAVAIVLALALMAYITWITYDECMKASSFEEVQRILPRRFTDEAKKSIHMVSNYVKYLQTTYPEHIETVYHVTNQTLTKGGELATDAYEVMYPGYIYVSGVAANAAEQALPAMKTAWEQTLPFCQGLWEKASPFLYRCWEGVVSGANHLAEQAPVWGEQAMVYAGQAKDATVVWWRGF